MHTWNEDAPIYRQLAGRLTGQLMAGDPPEGEALPSVRVLASQYLINPLTVGRALQVLVDEGLVESRRGMGMYVLPGARSRLALSERANFLEEEWPRLRARLKRLGIQPHELKWEE
jgi:GntR family transcriptional regulator